MTTGVRKLPSGKYQARIRLDGTDHSETFDTEREAAEWRVIMQARSITGALPANVTVNVYSARWLDTYRTGPSNTLRNYETDLRLRILPAIGDRPIGTVTKSDITRLVNAVVERQSPAVGRHMVSTLSAMFAAAADDDVIVKSPVRSRRHRPSHQPAPKPVWEQPQARQVLLMMGGYQRDAALLQLAWGARVSEIAGLTVHDVDLDRGQIDIRRRVTNSTVRATKNHRHRRLDIPDVARSTLERLVRESFDPDPIGDLGGREHDARRWVGHWLIQTSTGFPVSRHTLNPALAEAARRVGVPVLSSHGLRHTFVSWMVDEGYTADQIGHWIGDTAGTVRKIYSHMLEASSAKPAGVVDRALGNLDVGRSS